MIRILGKPECPFCWKVRLALSETGLGYQSLPVDPATVNGREILAQHSPQGTVPVLTHGDVALWESSIMVEYIHDLGGHDLGGSSVELLPVDPAARAQARTVQYYSDRIVGPSLRKVIFEKRDKPAGDWNVERIREGTEGWLGCQAHLERLLEGKEFFADDEFSIAECALIPRFGLAERYDVGVTGKFPNLARWFAAMKARPSYAATAPEFLPRPTPSTPPPAAKKRPFQGMVPPT